MSPAKKSGVTASSASETTFKSAFEELEKIAEKFEGEEVDLEKGLQDFERGLELASICKKKLGALEARVREIQEKFEV